MRFQYTIKHVPGKELYTPDTLSRAPVNNPANHLASLATEDIKLYIQTFIDNLPADKDRLNTYREAQANDSILIGYCKSGWPSMCKLKGEIKKYQQFAGEFSLLLYGSRIVVPESMRQITLQKIHQGHQGIQKCRLRVNTLVWWPEFATTYGFNHITSSPYYPQSDGLAERTVRMVKRLFSNSPDPFLALLSYRATPLPWCGLSPAELLMGHVIRKDVPQTTSKFYPE